VYTALVKNLVFFYPESTSLPGVYSTSKESIHPLMYEYPLEENVNIQEGREQPYSNSSHHSNVIMPGLQDNNYKKFTYTTSYDNNMMNLRGKQYHNDDYHDEYHHSTELDGYSMRNTLGGSRNIPKYTVNPNQQYPFYGTPSPYIHYDNGTGTGIIEGPSYITYPSYPEDNF